MSGAGSRTARFVFLSDSYARPRPGSLQTAASAPPPPDVAATLFGWRLVAANNRALGRGPYTFAGLDACRDDAWRVHDSADRAVPALAFNAQLATWSWQVSVDGRPVGVGVHSYVRRAECHRGLVQFLAVLPTAKPADGVVRHFGPRALHGHLPYPDDGAVSAVLLPVVAMGET